MRAIVHLSDLHFGRIDPQLLGPLQQCVGALRPDVVVVSGDLTQRARVPEFTQARQFLAGLPQPQVVVPGNHDIPLYDVVRRLMRPLARYRRYISDELEPCYIDDEVVVIGVNTARSLTIKDGRVNRQQLARLTEQLASLPQQLVRIVVTHHPFDLPGQGRRDLVGRASLAMAAFAQSGVDILLSGHMHASHAGNTARRYALGGYAALTIQAGTATSTRGRGEANAFNLIRIDGAKLELTRYGWDGAAASYRAGAPETFIRKGSSWAPVG